MGKEDSFDIARIERCIPTYVVADLAIVSEFLTQIVGFTVDSRSFDDCGPDELRVLVKDDLEVRIRPKMLNEHSPQVPILLVLECHDCDYWNDKLWVSKFRQKSVFHQDIGAPRTVTCYVAEDFQVDFEQTECST